MNNFAKIIFAVASIFLFTAKTNSHDKYIWIINKERNTQVIFKQTGAPVSVTVCYVDGNRPAIKILNAGSNQTHVLRGGCATANPDEVRVQLDGTVVDGEYAFGTYEIVVHQK